MSVVSVNVGSKGGNIKPLENMANGTHISPPLLFDVSMIHHSHFFSGIDSYYDNK
jgi:hypothetical protein